MPKKIICGFLISVILWIAFIWCKYLFFQKHYTQGELNTSFNSIGLHAPNLDSVEVGNQTIHYLSNQLNGRSVDIKPYIFFINDSGKNAGFYLRYFKDQDINQKYHLIAMERVGSGKIKTDKNFNYEDGVELFKKGIQEILKHEGYVQQKLHFVASGSSSMSGVLAVTSLTSENTTSFIFYPKIDPRFIASRGLSELIVSLGFLFPQEFVNKQKDLLFWDITRSEDQLKWFTEAKEKENQLIKINKHYKAIYFMVTNKWFEDKINDITKSKNFAVEAIKRRSIYRDPNFVIEEIEKKQ